MKSITIRLTEEQQLSIIKIAAKSGVIPKKEIHLGLKKALAKLLTHLESKQS